MCQCILDVPQWNDWRNVTYSEVHGSSKLKALSFESFNWVLWQASSGLSKMQNLEGPTFSEEKKIDFFIWENISYLNLT